MNMKDCNLHRLIRIDLLPIGPPYGLKVLAKHRAKVERHYELQQKVFVEHYPKIVDFAGLDLLLHRIEVAEY